MIVANTANGLISLLTFILMLSGSLQLWMLVSIGVLAAAAGAFHYAAFDASYAMLVPDRLLPRANGMMQTTWSLSGIISPALAAFIIALPALLPRDVGALAPVVAVGDGTPLVIAIDALTFFVCAAVLLFVHVPSQRAATSVRAAGSSRACGRTSARARYTSGSDPRCCGCSPASPSRTWLLLRPGSLCPCSSSSILRPIGQHAATPLKPHLPCLVWPAVPEE